MHVFSSIIALVLILVSLGYLLIGNTRIPLGESLERHREYYTRQQARGVVSSILMVLAGLATSAVEVSIVSSLASIVLIFSGLVIALAMKRQSTQFIELAEEHWHIVSALSNDPATAGATQGNPATAQR